MAARARSETQCARITIGPVTMEWSGPPAPALDEPWSEAETEPERKAREKREHERTLFWGST